MADSETAPDGRGCWFSILGLIVGVLIGAVFFYFVQQWFFQSRNPTFACENLPGVEQVAQVMEDHAALRERIMRINPGKTIVEVDTESCPGRAGIVIYYGLRNDRQRIEALIGGDTFYGVPYLMKRYP